MAIKLNNKDYIWSYIGVFFSVFSQLLLVPFVLHYLTDDMYGLWGVFNSLVAITTLFDFGFSTTFARNINYCWNGATELRRTGVTYAENGEANFRLMKRAMEACRYVFLLISCIALLLMATAGTGYILYICRGISSNTPLIAWAFYGVAIFFNLYYGYFNSFLRGVGAIKDVNKATVIARCAQIALTVILLMCGCGIVGTGVAYLMYGLLFRLLGRRSFLRFQGIGDALKKIEEKVPRREVKEMFLVVWHNASREGIVTLSNYLANQACTILCSLFMSLSTTGMYSLAVQIATAISNVSSAMYTANQPVLQSAYVTNDGVKTKRTMSLIVTSYVAFFVVLTIAAATIGLPIIRFIKPNIELTIPILLGVCLYQFILKFRNCYTSYFSCTNRIPYVKPFILSAVFGVLLALVFMGWFKFGVWGLIAAQLISQCMFNAWYWTLKAHREMDLSAKETIVYGWDEMMKIIKNFLHRGGKQNA